MASALDLSNQAGSGLTGTIPDGLTRLTNLTSLSLAANELTGSIPSGVSALSLLQYGVVKEQGGGCYPAMSPRHCCARRTGVGAQSAGPARQRTHSVRPFNDRSTDCANVSCRLPTTRAPTHPPSSPSPIVVCLYVAKPRRINWVTVVPLLSGAWH